MNKHKRGLSGIKLVSAAAALMMGTAAQALPVIDFGVAGAYSGFFFGNVGVAADVEGRLAVGGNLTRGFDVGYRNPYGATTPSLVVGGNVSWTAGTLYNGPAYQTDTNASIGPWVPSPAQAAKAIYGGTFDATNAWGGKTWTPDGQFTKQAGYLDFAAAKTQLSGLSSNLGGLKANGTITRNGGNVLLTGDGVSDLVVFDFGSDGNIGNLTLQGVKAGAHVVINSSAKTILFTGGLGGDKAGSQDALAKSRDRLVYNLPNATSVDVASFLNGSVLAVNAQLSGSGHLEGTVIANSLTGLDNRKLELGYETYQPFTSAVPEPSSYAMLLAGLGAIGFIARRRKSA